jgi:DNA-binding response OmpR family regulator
VTASVDLMSSAPRVLIVEDDRSLAGLMAGFLGEAGYEVVLAYDGEQALRRLRSDVPDLALLDLGLPRLSGDDLSHGILAEADLPVIIVTGRRDPREVARFLDMGAQDYITKPFAKEELLGRVRAVLRRGMGSEPVHLDDVVVDVRNHEASVHGRRLDLTPIELGLFARLARGRLVPIRDLLRAGWQGAREVDPELLRGPLYRLRVKLAAADSGLDVENVRGVGYRLCRRTALTHAAASEG